MSEKIWIKMKRGLFRDPKHRQQMGGSIWLFGWLIDCADWETGTVSPYKDEDAATEMAASLSWVRKHRRILADLGYIKYSQHGPQGMSIIIMNWSNPRAYDGAVINKAKEGDTNDTPSDKGKGVTESVTESVTKSITDTIDDRDTPTLDSNTKNHPIKSARKADSIFDAVAMRFYGIADSAQVNGAGSRIAKSKKAIKEVAPEVTPEDIGAFCDFYKSKYPRADLPRDGEKIKTHWLAWKQSDKPVDAGAPEVEVVHPFDREAA